MITNRHSRFECSALTSSSVVSQAPPLFALIIGINKYKSFSVSTLKGAVPDASQVKQYLERDLGVPPSQIRYLVDNDAIRATIIKEFHALQDNPLIRYGDPIFIYYAGHGGETDAPQGWEAGDSKIQMLIPHDFRTEVNGREVPGIPDRTINTLLAGLSQKKGDNITVIFDCCHSGSGTRTDEVDPTRLARVTEVPHLVPADFDLDVWKRSDNSRGTQVSSGFLQSGLSSHVLLAACGAKEVAQEVQGHGVFTKAFLNTISSVGADKLTYADLLQRMHALPGQNPQCEGVNQNRIVFNSKAPAQGRVLFDVRMDGTKYVMDAGAAHGITDGAEFAVYKDSDSASSSSPPLCKLVVLHANAFNSTMAMQSGFSETSLEKQGVAFQTTAGAESDLSLHVAMGEKLTGIFEAFVREMQRTRTNQQKILLVDKHKADIDIALEDNRVIFNILNPLVTQYGLTRIPLSVTPNVDDIYPVIRALAHYNWHLRRANKSTSEVPLYENIRIEITKLKELDDEFDDDFNPVIQPEGGNLNIAGVVDIVVDEDAKYGIKVINDSDLDLYPALFFFDNSDLSITSYYQPPTAGKHKVDAPLKGKQSLTIGYGAGGAAPFNYFVREGQDVDIGFLKLFVTSEHVDFSNVPQASPFLPNDRHVPLVQRKVVSKWDTVLVTVVQRRFRT